MVFWGGCAACLLLTDPAAPTPRVTCDVDVIVEAASLLDCHIQDARPEIIDEIQQAAKELRSYLSDTFSELINARRFTDALPVVVTK
jgi:Trm5-related predicted tRNA methylase